MPTTENLIKAFATHRAQAPVGTATPHYFWELVLRFRAELINQGYAVLGNLQDAEDIAQETLCEAFRQIDTLKDPHKIGYWIRKINRRNALDLLRRRKNERGKIERARRISGRREAITGGYGRLELSEVVTQAIDSLPKRLREIVVLRYWEHLSYQELADRIGVPLGTIKSTLARADNILAKRLQKYMDASASIQPVQEQAVVQSK